MAILPLKRNTLKVVRHLEVWQLEAAGVPLDTELALFDLLVWSLCDGKSNLNRMIEVMSDVQGEESAAVVRTRVEDAIMTLTGRGLLDLVSSHAR